MPSAMAPLDTMTSSRPSFANAAAFVTEGGVAVEARALKQILLNGVQALALKLTDGQTGDLNPLGVNCLRDFPVYGRVVRTQTQSLKTHEFVLAERARNPTGIRSFGPDLPNASEDARARLFWQRLAAGARQLAPAQTQRMKGLTCRRSAQRPSASASPRLT